MIKPLQSVALIISALIVSFQSSIAYEIPQRRIDLKPYINLMFPDKLLQFENQDCRVEDKMGIGFGIKARTQIAGCWGFVINTSITDLQVTDNSLSTASIFTAGFFYTRVTQLGQIALDAGLGVISVADHSAMLFMPGLEYSREIAERISLSAEINMPIANDWFNKYDIKEDYKSIAIAIGGTIIF